MNKQFAVIVVVIVAALIGVFSLTSKKDQESSNQKEGSAQAAASEHVVGEGTTGVTLVEYGDFQCPACKSYYPLVKQVKEEYGDKIKFQFRHFPLTQIHQNAMIASRAAEAAGMQDKFFEMHDLLYDNQDTWAQSPDPTATFVSYAQQLNLDVEKFKTDMRSKEVADIINADVKAAQALGATSTPTFVINGKRIEENPRSVEDFKKLIDEAAHEHVHETGADHAH